MSEIILSNEIIVSYSGGKDSTATLLLALETGRPVIPVFADTGNESRLLHEYLDYVEKAVGINIVRLKRWAVESPFEHIVKQYAMFPGFGCRFCTEQLKVSCINKYAAGREQWIGIRRDESKARSTYTAWNGKKHYPILAWTEKQVFDFIHAHGLRHNPIYDLGFERVGCFPCVMAKKKDVYLIQKYFPERIEELIQLEKDVTAIRAEKKPDKSEKYCTFFKRFSVEQAVEWSKTDRGGRQYFLDFGRREDVDTPKPV